LRNQCTSITNACLINLLFLTIFRIVILVDVRAHNCYIFKSRQPSQAMSLHLRIRAHSRHPSYKTIGDVCFDCASQIFTSVLPAHEWKLGVLMEKLCDVFMHSSLWCFYAFFKKLPKVIDGRITSVGCSIFAAVTG